MVNGIELFEGGRSGQQLLGIQPKGCPQQKGLADAPRLDSCGQWGRATGVVIAIATASKSLRVMQVTAAAAAAAYANSRDRIALHPYHAIWFRSLHIAASSTWCVLQTSKPFLTATHSPKHRLLHILAACPSPFLPKWCTFVPMACSSGRAAATASVGPPTCSMRGRNTP